MFERAGHASIQVHTNSKGAYSVVLAPGTYGVALAKPRKMDPTHARVVSGSFRRVDFSIDTGIR